jgi:hypothetical protein
LSGLLCSYAIDGSHFGGNVVKFRFLEHERISLF